MFWTFNSDRGADLGSLWLVASSLRPHGLAATRSTCVLAGLRRLVRRGPGARAARAARRRGWPSSGSWSWPASCWSTRSTRRSTCCGCCRWPCWPGRGWRDQLDLAGRRDLLLRRACGGTSAASSRPAVRRRRRFYWVAILVRVAAELYLVAIVVRDVLRPAARPGAQRPHARSRRERAGSADDDAVERRRGVADPTSTSSPTAGHLARRAAGTASRPACAAARRRAAACRRR